MSENKTHWRVLVNPDFLGAYSLKEGKDLIVEIVEVKRQMVKGDGGKQEECTVAILKNQKPFILNRTNQKTIQKIYNTPYIEDWTGKKITLYATTTKVAGDTVECLRIRQAVPKLPDLKIEDNANFDKIVAAIKGGYTIEQVRTKWTISPETEKQLITAANETV